jgi:hypothetical protein
METACVGAWLAVSEADASTMAWLLLCDGGRLRAAGRHVGGTGFGTRRLKPRQQEEERE